MRLQRLVLALAVLGCAPPAPSDATAPSAAAAPSVAAAPATATAATGTASATFAGGCFWSMEKAFEAVPGVVSATSGFSGGTVKDPSYDLVVGGATGHAEAVRVVYDPGKVTYATLLDQYWRHIDPFAVDAQFCDHGPQYRTVVFTHDAAQRELAEATKAAVAKRFGKPVATAIEPAGAFFPAEPYHQDFARLNPMRYEAYRIGCRRDASLRAIWGDEAGT